MAAAIGCEAVDAADETTGQVGGQTGQSPAGQPVAGQPSADPYAGRSPYPPPATGRHRPGWTPGAAGWTGGAPFGGAPPGSWLPPAPGQQMRMPSGLFPSGPPRPVYREPFPIRGGAVALGIVGGGLWMMLFGLLASTAGGYAWVSLIAGLVATGVAVLLARLGDRGAAVGIALAVAVGLSVTAVVVAVRWAGGDWVLW